MTVELKTANGYIWATKVENGKRFHLACMGEETAEALRVALNKRHKEQRAKARSK